jgi:hypothetical protein
MNPRRISTFPGSAIAGIVLMFASSVQAEPLPVTADLRLHLEADAGITLDGSGRVSTWADQSAFSHDFSQATATARPTFVSGGGPSGTDVVSFDGVDDSLTHPLNQILASTSFTIFTVMSVNGPHPWMLGATPSDRLFYTGFPVSGLTDTNSFEVSHDNLREARATLPGIGDPNAKILTITSSGTIGSVEVFADGVAAGMTYLNPSEVTDFSIGNFLGQVAGGPPVQVDFSAFIAYNAKLSTADRLSVESHLSSKYFEPPSPVPVLSTRMVLLLALVMGAGALLLPRIGSNHT